MRDIEHFNSNVMLKEKTLGHVTTHKPFFLEGPQ